MPIYSRRFALLGLLVVVFSGRLSAQKPAQSPGEIIQARLLSPISTQTSKEGDRFTLQVLAPDAYRDAVIEGHVIKAKGSGRVKGKSELLLGFDSLTVHGRTFSITGDLRDVRNSKGTDHVDEEGRVIGRGSKGRDIATILALSAAGAAIGGAAAGKAGALEGAGLGAAVAITIVLSTKGPEIEFAPGSEFTLAIWKK